MMHESSPKAAVQFNMIRNVTGMSSQAYFCYSVQSNYQARTIVLAVITMLSQIHHPRPYRDLVILLACFSLVAQQRHPYKYQAIELTAAVISGIVAA